MYFQTKLYGTWLATRLCVTQHSTYRRVANGKGQYVGRFERPPRSTFIVLEPSPVLQQSDRTDIMLTFQYLKPNIIRGIKTNTCRLTCRRNLPTLLCSELPLWSEPGVFPRERTGDGHLTPLKGDKGKERTREQQSVHPFTGMVTHLLGKLTRGLFAQFQYLVLDPCPFAVTRPEDEGLRGCGVSVLF